MKAQINNLKSYAELAWASYFYFDLLKDSNNTPRKTYELDKQGNKIKDKDSPRGYKEIELTLKHIISQKYKGQEVLVNLKEDNTWQSNLLNILGEKTNTDKLNGEFSQIQAKNFFKRYELMEHCPNTDSGFSATLFQDKESKEFILAFRGTEGFTRDMFITDLQLLLSSLTNQYQDMLLFYYQCIGKLPFCIPKNTPLQKKSLEFEISIYS